MCWRPALRSAVSREYWCCGRNEMFSPPPFNHSPQCQPNLSSAWHELKAWINCHNLNPALCPITPFLESLGFWWTGKLRGGSPKFPSCRFSDRRGKGDTSNYTLQNYPALQPAEPFQAWGQTAAIPPFLSCFPVFRRWIHMCNLLKHTNQSREVNSHLLVLLFSANVFPFPLQSNLFSMNNL